MPDTWLYSVPVCILVQDWGGVEVGVCKTINLSHGITTKINKIVIAVFLVNIIYMITYQYFLIKNSFTLSENYNVMT